MHFLLRIFSCCAIEGARVVRQTARRVALARPSEAEAFE